MRRILVPVVVLTVALTALIAYRIHAQDVALRADSGGSGEIEGVEVRLAAKIASRVLAVHAAQGQAVKQGDRLVTLDCAEPQALLADAKARLAAANAQAASAQAALAAARAAAGAAQASSRAAQAQAEALAAQRDASLRQAARLDEIGEFATASNRDLARSNALGLQHQAEAARAAAKAATAQSRSTREQVRAAEAQAEAAQAAVAAAEAAVSRAQLGVEECEIRAPRDAVVEHVAFEPGELIAPGAVLVRLLDMSEARATFYLPNAEIAAVRPGAPAVVEVDAYPGEQFHGTVRTVSLQAEFTPRNIQTRTDRDRLVYPVEVVLPNADGRLRAGMPVQVTLPGTRRK